MIEILRKLRAEHDDLAKVLDVLEHEVESYRQRGRLNRDIVDDVLDYCRGYPALCHHPKEDLIYHKLRLAAEPAAINTVGDLLAEHEALSALTDELEAAVDNLLSDAGENRARFVRVAEALHERHRHHIKAEEDELFPVAMECLSDEDWAKIDHEAMALEASQPTGAIDERFAAFSREIVERECIEQERRDNLEAVL
ncbi:MAG: hemerythrin domain-containing protein [Planctomycetota bacterium]|jgi:hemerythrin-like domain-containing protein